MIISISRIIVVASLCALALWQSVSFRTGGFAPNDFIDEFETVSAPQDWQHMHPDHWVQLSRQMMSAGDHTSSLKYAIHALSNNITNGGAASQLLHLYEIDSSTKEQEVERIALFTEKLWPTHASTTAHLADYWAKRENLEQVINKWNTLLTKTRSLDKELFPHLKSFLTTPSTSQLLEPYTKKPPLWWSRFFNYLANQKENYTLDTMKTLYQLRVDSGFPLDDYERRIFVRLLISKQRWQEAYFAWMGGLNTKQLELSGLLFDGGFESESHDTGFDWRFSKHKMIKIQRDITYGMRGRKALSITLRDDKRVNFHHIRQNMLLPSGNYELNGRYRLDQLQTEEGLRWRIRCIDNNKIIGESLSFAGRSPWNTFKFSFVVPDADDNCSSQYLRLEASSTYAHKHRFQGKLWFDDLRIERTQSQTDTTGNVQ